MEVGDGESEDVDPWQKRGAPGKQVPEEWPARHRAKARRGRQRRSSKAREGRVYVPGKST